jgi:PST family polysaccharide transporter
MNFAQIVMPLVLLPYLTRVLSIQYYGVYSYVKSLMIYVTLIIEFGFLLSGTKNIVEAKGNLKIIGRITGNILVCKLFLSLISFIFLIGMIFFVPLLRENFLFTILSFIPGLLTSFLFDFLFRGLEEMQVVTVRYLIMRLISTLLTFIIVKGDSDFFMLPIIDCISTFISIIWIFFKIKELEIKISVGKFSEILSTLKESNIYFLSNIASTAFSALNTLFVGIYLSSSDIAFWGLTMTLISGIQSLYSPIADGIYPRMIEVKQFKIIKGVLIVFLPLVLIGCSIIFFYSGLIMSVIGGEKYIVAGALLKKFIPLIIMSFGTSLFGWPVLGAINKVKETTFTTLFSACVQVLGLLLIVYLNIFSIVNLIILRTLTEFIMLSMRIFYSYKFKNMFN